MDSHLVLCYNTLIYNATLLAWDANLGMRETRSGMVKWNGAQELGLLVTHGIRQQTIYGAYNGL